jgi:hypothetical protein
VSLERWQLFTAIHDKGDGLILCQCHLQGYDCTHSGHVWLGLAITDTTIYLQSLIVESSLQSYRYIVFCHLVVLS